MATPLEDKTLAELYQAMSDLEAQALEIKAERKALGDEIRRRAEAEQVAWELAALSPAARAALESTSQTVGR